MTENTNTFVFQAPSSWLKKLNRSIILSHEPSGSVSGGSDSPMSCVSFSTEFDGLHIESESVSSKMHVVVPEDATGYVSYEGECEFIVPVKSFVSVVEQASSSDHTCKLIFEQGVLNVVTENGEVDFNVDVIENLNDKPRAPKDFPEKLQVARVNGQEIFDAHKIGSVMVKKQDKDISTGQDPMSGCIMIMNEDSIGFYSLFTSASSSLTSSETIVEGENDGDNFILSQPSTTSQILAIFNNDSDSVDICFDSKNSRIHMECGLFHLSFSALNTHHIINHKPKINQLMDLIEKKGEKVVRMSFSKKELSDALSRMHSVSAKDTNANIGVSNNSIRVTSPDSASNRRKLFKQNITSNVQWDGDSEIAQSQWIEFSVDYATMKSVIANTPMNVPFEVTVYYKPDKTPWVMIIKNSDDEKADLVDNCFFVSIFKV